MKPTLSPIRLVLSLGLVALVAGCRTESNTSAVPAEVATKYQGEFLGTQDPPEATPVAAVRAAIAASDDPSQEQEVVVVGHIGGMPNPYREDNLFPAYPWVEESAVFFLVDPSTVEEFKQHPHEKGKECSFCMGLARKLADTAAIVELRDSQGKPLGYRADRLLGLREGDRIVVQGTGKLVADSEMMIVADRIFVSDEPPAP